MGDQKIHVMKALPGDDSDLPPGEYIFLEMFCDGIDCDCRRVLFSVTTSEELALVYWGWESLDFYRRNMKGQNPFFMKGPGLSLENQQSLLAPALLKVVCDKLIKR
jgi:hypothetical protein